MRARATQRRRYRAAWALSALSLFACWGSAAHAWQSPPVAADAPASVEGLQDGPRISIADPTLVQQFVDALKQTREALTNYRWQERTVVRIDDAERIVQLFAMRYDRQQRMRRTLTGHEFENPDRDGPIRRQVLPVETEAQDPQRPPPSVAVEAPQEQAAALKRLAESYYLASPSDIQRVPLIPAPLVSLQPLGLQQTDADEAPADTGFSLYDVLQAGDTVQVWMDESGDRPVRVHAVTDLAGTPVEVDAEYSRLPDGTIYPARTWVRTVIEDHPVELRIDTFDFDKRR